MHYERDIAEFFFQRLEHLGNLLVVRGLAGQDESAVHGGCQSLHTPFKAVSLVGEGDTRPRLGEGLCDAPSDTTVIGYAEYNTFLAGQVYRKHLATSLI